MKRLTNTGGFSLAKTAAKKEIPETPFPRMEVNNA
jgi:hypothetical protein